MGMSHIVGDELIIETNEGKTFRKICLPFLAEAKKADFLFYKPTNSVFPNPFTSVTDLIP